MSKKGKAKPRQFTRTNGMGCKVGVREIFCPMCKYEKECPADYKCGGLETAIMLCDLVSSMRRG